MRSLRYLFVTLLLLVITACGDDNDDRPASPPASQAILKVSLTGALPAGSSVIGAGFTVTLPADVTPDIADGAAAANTVATSGAFAGGTLTPPVYTTATATNPGTVAVAVASSDPAGVTEVGELATLTLKLSNGAAPSAASFAINDVNVIDTAGNLVPGIGASVTGLTLR